MSFFCRHVYMFDESLVFTNKTKVVISVQARQTYEQING